MQANIWIPIYLSKIGQIYSFHCFSIFFLSISLILLITSSINTSFWSLKAWLELLSKIKITIHTSFLTIFFSCYMSLCLVFQFVQISHVTSSDTINNHFFFSKLLLFWSSCLPLVSSRGNYHQITCLFYYYYGVVWFYYHCEKILLLNFQWP